MPADPADVTVAMEGDLRDGGKAVVGIVRLVLDVALDGGYAPTSEVTFSGRPYELRIACHVTLLANPILAITRKMHQEGTTLEKPTDGRQKRSQASTRRRQYSEGPSIPTPSRARGCDRGALFATLRQLVSTPASQVCLLLGFAPSTVIVRKIALSRLRIHAGFRSSIFVKNHPFGGCARLCLLI